jgi:hypothetical protein
MNFDAALLDVTAVLAVGALWEIARLLRDIKRKLP